MGRRFRGKTASAEVAVKLRWLLALVGLMIVTPDLVHADYLMMILNLGEARLPSPHPPQGGQAGMMGQAGIGGAGAAGVAGMAGMGGILGLGQAGVPPNPPPVSPGPRAGNIGALGYGGFSLHGGPAVAGNGVGG